MVQCFCLLCRQPPILRLRQREEKLLFRQILTTAGFLPASPVRERRRPHGRCEPENLQAFNNILETKDLCLYREHHYRPAAKTTECGAAAIP